MQTELLKDIDLSCYHCGEKCSDETLHFQSKVFCCTGCKTVYEILDENGLSTYYDLEAAPGTTQKGRALEFAFLDEEPVLERLLDFRDGNIGKITFSLPQIHCSSCIWLLENLYKLNKGVASSRVNFLKKTLQVTFYHQQTSLRQLATLLASIGYHPEISLSDISGDAKTDTQKAAYKKRLLYKLGVAGFCFGNIMFFSLPEYFSDADFFLHDFKGLFSWLNILLALPVFFYSAYDYFVSAYNVLKQKSVNMDVPIALGILALFFYSLYDIFFLMGAGYLDSLAALLFFLLLGKLYQQKTFDRLSFDRDYKAYFPVAVTLLTKNGEQTVSLNKLAVGDRILIRNNELIPADTILLRGNGMIDYSFVTGESIPVPKVSGELIYAGGRQVAEAVELEVVKAPSQSYLTSLWNNEAFAIKENNLNNLSTKISKHFTLIVLLIAFSSLFYWWGIDQGIALKAFTSVLIIACPCALAMSTPFTLGNSLRVLGKNKFYLKNADIIEKMAVADSVVFDKTGTLSQSDRSFVEYYGTPLIHEESQWLKSLMQNSTHVLSMRIYGHLKSSSILPVDGFLEVTGKGISGKVAGRLVKAGSAGFVGATKPAHEKGSLVFVQIDSEVKGYFKVQIAYREGMDTLISQLAPAYQLYMLSGDHDHERGTLGQIFKEKVQMHFHQGPADKLEFISGLEKQGKKVIMVGDGLNDAGALKASSVGIALTENITHFSPACDAIMEACSFSLLDRFFAFAKKSRYVIMASFGLSFCYNVIGLSFAVQGALSPVISAILMPVSSISVVVFTSLATNMIAAKIGLTNLKSMIP
jgi:P-type Cu+ transporter